MNRRELVAGMAALAVGASCRRVASESLLVAGAKAMETYTNLLADGFRRRNERTTVVVEAGGAAASVIALKRGAIDVATMLRDFTEEEEDPLLRNYLVARDGIAILVNPANPVRSLTMAQLRGIYAGTIRSWAAVGGSDAPIELVLRSEASHTARSLRDMLLGGDRLPAGLVAKSRAEMTAMVALRPGALGFSAFAGVGAGVSLLAVEDVTLTPLTILSGRYPLSRSFYLVLYGSSTPAAERFVSFAIGNAGQRILEKAGLLPAY